MSDNEDRKGEAEGEKEEEKIGNNELVGRMCAS